MRITEIEKADDVPKLNWDDNVINKSKFVTHLDGNAIYRLDEFDNEFYFVYGKIYDKLTYDDLLAYVVIKNKDGFQYLVRIENLTKYKGLVTGLIMYLVSIGQKFRISKREGLSADGFNWLINLIKKGGYGLKITDQNGDKLDTVKLKREWDMRVDGQTEVLIENHNIDLREHIERWNEFSKSPEQLLVPPIKFLYE